MSTDRHVWEIPADEFIGVPYIFEGGSHPYREQSVAPMGRLTDYKHGGAASHRFMPDGFTVSRMSDGRGFVLLDADKVAVGIYHRRVQGYLLRLLDRARHQGLGYRFLAACLDLQDHESGRCVWVPGTYSDSGLLASMRAHRMIVADALERGMPVPPGVLAKMEWSPAVVGARSMGRDDVEALRGLADSDLDYKEAMAVIALLVGRGARLEALYDRADELRRPETFVLCLGADVYQGFDIVSKQAVVDAAVDYYNSRGAQSGCTSADFAFRKVSVESVCRHKNTQADRLQAFLGKVMDEGDVRPCFDANGESTARRRQRPGR